MAANLKKILCLLAVIVISVGAMAQEETVNERSLTNTLKELNLELKTQYDQRPETQQFFNKEYKRQHQRMIDVITHTNEFSILLYSREQNRTFDMAYALKKVTTSYDNFSKGMRPYDQIINELSFEIERYARLIESLRRLPPEMKEIEVEIEVEKVLDSLINFNVNDSLDTTLSTITSYLEKEIIQIAIKDSTSAPFVLDKAGEEYRDSCIFYASELLKMFAKNRNAVVADSTHYKSAFLRTEEAYNYAEALYAELDKYVFKTGQKPYSEILSDFDTYWKTMKKEMRNEYDFDALKKAKAEDKEFYNKLSGRAEKAYSASACSIQLGTLFVVWLFVFGILWLLRRYTKFKNVIQQKSLFLFSVLVGTILYFLMFGYFWQGSEYVHYGVKNINTFLWLLAAIAGSLLLRVKPNQLRHGFCLYLPTILLSLFIIICRNTFIPDILLNIVFTPVLLVAVLGQLVVCLIERGKAPRTDSILGWISLGIYSVALIVSFFGFIFFALIGLVFWYFMLVSLSTIFCISDLMDRYKEKRLDERIEANRKHNAYVYGEDSDILNFRVTWFHDFIKQVVVPALLLYSLPLCVRLSLDVFDFTDLFSRYYFEPFFQLTDEATGISSLRVSIISIVYLMFLFCLLRYINRVIHVIWHHIRYSAFMRKHKRDYVRANEINLSIGNSIISSIIWMIYVIAVVEELKVPTRSLGLIAGGLSAGIGIALKDIINNFIYGIQLMGGRLRVGDWIECEGVRGRVTAINYQCVLVETINGTEMSFMNASLFGQSFNNLTRNNSYEFTKIIVGVEYGTDVEKVREVLEEAMKQMDTKDSYGRNIVDPKKGIYIVLDNMSESAVDIAVKQYVLVPERIAYVDRSKEVIYKALNDAGITIAFPQCDIHVKDIVRNDK
ncbi:MAG: mechanosensitive ion channel [Bacteroidales bacterium]|nr:mechanosensitive ion channel [Bacteroidales bacterium]